MSSFLTICYFVFHHHLADFDKIKLYQQIQKNWKIYFSYFITLGEDKGTFFFGWGGGAGWSK